MKKVWVLKFFTEEYGWSTYGVYSNFDSAKKVKDERLFLDKSIKASDLALWEVDVDLSSLSLPERTATQAS